MERQSKGNIPLLGGEKLPFTTDELCLLGVCMGYVSVPELGAELPGRPKEHLTLMLPAMVESLVEKGVLRPVFGHAPRVQAGYRETVATVFDPEDLLDFTALGERLRCFMRGERCLVVNGQGTMYAFASRQTLFDALQTAIPQRDGGETDFSLPLQKAEEAKTLYNAFQKGEAEALLRDTLTEQETELWLELLSGAMQYMEIQLYSHESSSYRLEQGERLALGTEDMLKISLQEDSVWVQSVSTEDVKNTLQAYCEHQEDRHG